MQRTYPELSEIGAPSVSISFVCVHFSEDLEHNLLQSHDISDPRNELILVDNRGGVHFDNLSSALAHGLHRARHEIIAFIHEDVLLPRHWQAHLEKAIDALNEHDPDWGILGSAGWSDAGELIGHYSDPHRFLNTFDGEPYQPAARLDEQLLGIVAAAGRDSIYGRFVELDHPEGVAVVEFGCGDLHPSSGCHRLDAFEAALRADLLERPGL